jgi:hypothetical protein
VVESFRLIREKATYKEKMLHRLHLVATDCSSVTSDTGESCFSEARFGVVSLSKNVEAEKEVKISRCQVRQSLSQDCYILMIML